ncbi:nitrite reductase/ring-hydroxylating ferredoxin subunit [Virgibacillus natechei]|uniref:Nitrite reductase/ring-hydroxylating ferredoxin subunit n=1 Tax=Virgibacillus natechei TaxID=1216297 RepID=A0ABS4IIN5_9BACI|nr:Rieske (2Fe-2S) protein [Virgibacillus natechei]MBP1970818.1 nitrite reductase/ring-hydroxylating ferredoxin subunit [Virgibacillus natechei]UZD12289.1 Rieske (2Fe-2S) protein [Virgibacillus natechei]
MREVVCEKEDIHPGKMRSATLGKIPIVVCRTKDGEFYAFANRCLHQGAPLSEGILCGDTKRTDIHGNYEYIKDGEILRCPWHALEYDIKNDGVMLAEPDKKLRSFQVAIEDDQVVVYK